MAWDKQPGQETAILNQLAMGIVLADQKQNCVFANPAAEQILGSGLSGIPLQDWSRHCGLFGPNPVTALAAEQLPLLRALRGETVENLELFVRGGSNGAGIWISAAARPLPPPLGGMMVCQDITGRHKAEEEQDRLRAALQQRTGELEVLNKELEALAYSISHDLRAPLRHIDAFTTLVAKEAAQVLSKEGNEFLDVISESARSMARLLEHLLIFSRLSRAEMLPQTVDLNAALEDVLTKLLQETEGRKIIWKKQPLPHVEADAAMLQQALTNLLSNAIKFTRDCEPAEIEIGCQNNSPQKVIIYVRDNGVGFDMQYADKLFGLFQKLHRVEDFEGPGLGLASVRRIIARHGGRTWAEAKVNGGATFYFSLPKERVNVVRAT